MFNEDILIDRNALEEECSTTPAFFDYWINQESNLKSKKENKKSELSKSIRQMSESEVKTTYGFSKVTEGAIESIIESDPTHQSLKSQHTQAEASRKSYEKKISMLETLAKLHGQGYFAKIEGKSDVRTLLANKVKKKIREEIKKRSEKLPKRKPQRLK